MILIRQELVGLELIEHVNAACGFYGEPLERWSDVTWWIARDAERVPVAFGGARRLTHEPWAWFERCGVAPHARGLGLQRRLIFARLAWVRRQGLHGALTYTLSSNVASANNLIECGFRLREPECAPYGREGVLYWMHAL